jgi:hypothetical protein
VAGNTQQTIQRGRIPVVHGDEHAGEEGCGANKHLRPILAHNARNIDVIAPRAWAVAEAVGITAYLTEDDVTTMIVTGAKNAEDESIWDTTAAERIEIAVQNGATYVVCQGAHTEGVILAKVSEGAIDKDQYNKDHTHPDGTIDEVFIASMGEYAKVASEDAQKEGLSERDAAINALGFILWNIGTPKDLTAEELGNGEALPVGVIK